MIFRLICTGIELMLIVITRNIIRVKLIVRRINRIRSSHRLQAAAVITAIVMIVVARACRQTFNLKRLRNRHKRL